MIIVGFADNIMVGRYSTEALASASFVNNVFNVAIFCCIGFTYGLTPLVGALFSKNDSLSIGSLTRKAMLINIAYTMIVVGVMTVIYFNLDRLGQPSELLPLIRPYYRLYLWGMIPIVIFNVAAQWSYGINNTSMPMWIILAANLLNILGNYVLIYGHFGFPEMGLFGAGIATLAARCLCAAAMIMIMVCVGRFKEYRKGLFGHKGNPSDYMVLWKTSLPVSMQLSFESGSFTMAAIMVGWLGAIELAAFQVVVIVGTLGFCIYYSLGSAITIKVSNAAGLNDRRSMRLYATAGYHIMLVLALMSSVVFMTGGQHLMGLFSSDTRVVGMAVSLIAPLVLYQLGDATQIAYAGALRGTAHVMPMLWIAFISYVVVGVPATYALCFKAHLGLYGVVLSFSVSLFTAACLFYTYFMRATRMPRVE